MVLDQNGQSVFIPLEGQQVNKELLRTYIGIVLDKSGSMNDILDATIQGFNSQVDSIVKEAIGQVYLSLVTFNTNVEPVFFNRPPSHLTKLSRANYKPAGWTALYDAIGYTINRLEFSAEDVGNSAFLVIIVSDGLENRSQQYRWTLPNIIKQKQQTGRWTFVYVGSNHDIAQASQALFIPAANTYAFQNNSVGTAAAFNATSGGIGTYFLERKKGLTSSDSFYSGGSGSGLQDKLDSLVITTTTTHTAVNPNNTNVTVPIDPLNNI